MNTQNVTNMAALAAAPKMLGKGRFKWVLIAAGVYYGLKYLSKKGILPGVAETALQKVDAVVDEAKTHFGMNAQSH